MPQATTNFPGFASYYPMMSDQKRVQAYRDAIFSTVKPGDTVLDLGAGLGLLSFFAVQAGASKVYAIEERDSVHFAKSIATDNEMNDRIEFIMSNSMQVDLPEKVDVLVSETMGSFGIDENMAGFIEDARKRHLKPGGRIIPQSIRTFLALTDSSSFFEQDQFWKDINGLDFSKALEELWDRPQVISVSEDSICSQYEEFNHINFTDNPSKKFEKRFSLEVSKDTNATGLAGWFEVQLTDTISISTDPSLPQTHWKQIFFPLDEPTPVLADDTLLVEFVVEPSHEEFDQCDFSYRCTKL